MIYCILFLYIAFTFWGSLVGNKDQENTPESYFLANRGLGTIALFFTIMATNFSAFYFLGFAGAGYRIGYAFYPIMGLGTGLAGLSIYLIGKKVWELGKKNGYITPAELVYDQTKSRGLQYCYAGVMVLYTLPYLSLQIIGGGYILEELTNGQITYPIAIFALTLFTIIYVLIGGMHSVAKTDLKQGILVIAFMLCAVIAIGYQLGGLSQAHQKLYATQPELFSLAGVNQHYTPQKWCSFIVLWFFCIPMFPQLFMRFYIAKNLEHFKKSVILYAAIPLLIAIFPITIGVLGHLSFPDLAGKAADNILPLMLVKHTSEWFAGLVMIGAIAAFMSTLDSQLLAISTIMTRDFYLPISKKTVDFKQEVFIGRIMVVIFAIIGFLIALNPISTIFDMGKLAFAGYAMLFPTTIGILYFKKLHPSAGLLSILTGEVLLMLFYYDILPKAYLGGFEAYFPILLIATLIVLIGKQKPTP